MSDKQIYRLDIQCYTHTNIVFSVSVVVLILCYLQRKFGLMDASCCQYEPLLVSDLFSGSSSDLEAELPFVGSGDETNCPVYLMLAAAGKSCYRGKNLES